MRPHEITLLEFTRRLESAARAASELAATMVRQRLLTRLVCLLVPNVSYDGNPLRTCFAMSANTCGRCQRRAPVSPGLHAGGWVARGWMRDETGEWEASILLSPHQALSGRRPAPRQR